MFAFNAQGFPTGRQDVHLWRLLENSLGQCRGDYSLYKMRIIEGSQVDEVNGAAQLREQLVPYRNRDSGLADATWTRNRDEAMSRQLFRYVANCLVTADHP